MNIKAYYNSAEEARIDKSRYLTELGTFDMDIVETSVENTVLKIKSANIPIRANYFYIEEFGRYYFKDTTNNIRSDVWNISLKTDPLYTYKDQIYNLDVIAIRQKSDVDYYLNDDHIQTYSNPHIVTKVFPRGFPNTGDSIILITV